jgi:hypothetical protein
MAVFQLGVPLGVLAGFYLGGVLSESIISRLDASNNPNKEGLIICHELISKLMDLPGIDGVHLMGPSCEHDSAEIIKLFR